MSYSQYYKQRGKHVLSALVASAIIGIVAGICGGVIGSSIYTSHVLDQQPIFSNITFQPQLKTEIDQDKLQQTQLGMLQIYRKKVVNPNDVLSQIYTENELVGYAGVLTSDGVIFASMDVIPNPQQAYVAKTYDHKWYEVTSIFTDDATHVALARLKSISPELINTEIRLIPLPLQDKKEQISLLDTVYVLDFIPSLMETYIVHAPDYQFTDIHSYVLSSDEFTRRVWIEDSLTKPSLLFTDTFSLVGLSDFSLGKNAFVPAYVLKNMLSEYLKFDEVQRVGLNIDYIDLAHISVTSPEILKKGALVYTNRARGIVGIPFGSTAYTKGIRAGDVITHVNGVMLSSVFGLDEALLNVKELEELELQVVRDNEVKVISFKNE